MTRILFHIHVYYLHLFPELVRCVDCFKRVLPEAVFKILVTVPVCKSSYAPAIHESLPGAEILILPNLGYDIAPFIEVLNRVKLERYEYVVKLHTKRDKSEYHYFGFIKGSEWRDRLVSFCATDADVRMSLAMLEKHPDVGMVAGTKELDPSGMGVFEDLTIGDEVLEKIGLSRCRHDVVYGTMFMVRASLLKPFKKLKFDDFPAPPENDPHAIPKFVLDCEWALSRSVSAQGQLVLSNRHSYMWQVRERPIRRVFLKFIRFLVHAVRHHRLKWQILTASERLGRTFCL